ncbi:hypothetical protein C8F04DRAFT_1194658 [Mycena alexandri]|uniref:Ribonuclease H1 N-terminal domain-containing protein n=1 Tax=Mycena alexandri TaxID=1745969 RepID=A0AAD6S6T2_9AGAR|nr:hypothetical protein C8F04DRAFT_1194658 [Mycena alexandri]
MADASAAAINASTPEQELQSLISLLAAISQMSLELTTRCLDVQTRLPGVIERVLDAQTVPPILAWVPLVPRTPGEVEAAHPPPIAGSAERSYHVVTTGREPGLYDDVNDSNYQVLGVPNAKHRKVTGLAAALAYYRAKYDAQEVSKWGPQPAPRASGEPAAGSSSAAYLHSHPGVKVSVTIG